MLYHKRSQLAVQFTEDGHITVTHLIEYGDHTTFTIGGIVGGLQRTDVRDVTVVTNSIVVDVVTHLFYQTVITHRHITQRGIVDTRVLHKALRYLNHLLKRTETDITIKHHSVEIIGAEPVCHHHALPVLSPADIILQNLNFCLC